jgi:B12-binding domain/radical SAM domain protein
MAKLDAPDVIAYSFMTPNLDMVREEITVLRERFGAKVSIIAGGPHPSADPEGTIALGFDHAFVGESEETLLDFVRHADDAPAIIAPRNPVDIEKFSPFPRRAGMVAPLEITRGCIHHCFYCQTPQIFCRPQRHRSVESIVDHLRFSVQHGWTRSWFISPNSLGYQSPMDGKRINMDAIHLLLTEVRKAGITQAHFGSFPSEVRPDYVTSDVLKMLRSLCANKVIVMGVQSGSDRILQHIGRGHDVYTITEASRLAFEAGFVPHLQVMFGLPGESGDDQHATLSLCNTMVEKYNARIHAHIFLPLPGTPFMKAIPSPVDPSVHAGIENLAGKGRVDGIWKSQYHLREKILEWKNTGWIRT